MTDTTTLASLSPAALKLKEACDRAYIENPKSCSTAVWAVMKAMGFDQEPYRQANQLIDHLAATWTEVRPDKAQDLADMGQLVIAGAKEKPHGHVVVVYPGGMAVCGGYNFHSKGKAQTLPRGARYPRAMSTSMGGWPGAMSKGDKTVWDAWANNKTYAGVKYWTYMPKPPAP